MADPQLTVVQSAPLAVVSSAALGSAAAEGYYQHPSGARLPQSALTATPALARQIEREGSWQWHPPGVAPGQDATAGRADRAILGNVPVIGSVNPEDVLIAYAGGRGVASAMRGQLGAAAKTLAGLRATLATAAPAIKYEVTRTVLESVGVPKSVASALAVGVSMRGGRGAADAEAGAAGRVPAPTNPDAPHLDLTVPMRPGAMTQQEIAERLQHGTGIPTPMRDRVPVYGPRPTPGSVTPPLAPASQVPVVQSSAPSDIISGAVRLETPGAPAPAPRPRPVVAPPASPLVAPAPPTAAAPPTVVPTPPAASSPQAAWSPTRLRSEVGLAARRSHLTLTEAELAQADDLVRAGQTPEAAVRAVTPPPPVPKATMSAAEMRTYTDLRSGGMAHVEAVDLLQAQRDLAARLGTPTSETVRQTVAERNATGRWPGGTPGE